MTHSKEKNTKQSQSKITQEQIQHARDYMRMYASMMRDLSNSDDYILGLLTSADDELDPIEIGLRRQIKRHQTL